VPAPSAMPNSAQPAPGVQPTPPSPTSPIPPAARPDPLAAYWSLIPASRAGAMAGHPPIFLPPNPFSPENIPASAWLTPPPIFLNSPGAFPLTAPTPPDDPPTAAAHGLLGGLANLQAATSNAGTEAYAPGSRPFMSPGQTEYQGAGPLYAHVRSVPLSGIDPTGSATEGNANWSELSDARGSDDGVVLVGDKKTDRRNLDVLNERAFGITPPLGSTAPRLVPPAVGGPPPSQTPLQAPPKLEFPPGIGPGPFAGEPIPAGPGKRPNTRQQDQINASGDKYGCHTCGAPDAGTPTGN
jgi:hypothetical protein